MPKCVFSATLLKSHFGMGVFSRKFTAYFHNTFFKKHLWVAASEIRNIKSFKLLIAKIMNRGSYKTPPLPLR